MNSELSQKRLYRLAEIVRAAKPHGINRGAIVTAFESGQIPGVKIGSQWVATRADIEKGLGKGKARLLFGPIRTNNNRRTQPSSQKTAP